LLMKRDGLLQGGRHGRESAGKDKGADLRDL
jgi:hypothetical protein